MPTNRDTRQADYVCLLRIATRRMRSSERWSNCGVRVILGGSLAGKVCSSCRFNSSSSSCFLRCARVSLSWSSGKSPFSRRHFGSVWCARRIKGSWAPSDAAESGNLSPSSQGAFKTGEVLRTLASSLFQITCLPAPSRHQ
jgi:hypothetical protein